MTRGLIFLGCLSDSLGHNHPGTSRGGFLQTWHKRPRDKLIRFCGHTLSSLWRHVCLSKTISQTWEGEFHYIWHKHPVGLMDKLIRTWIWTEEHVNCNFIGWQLQSRISSLLMNCCIILPVEHLKILKWTWHRTISLWLVWAQPLDANCDKNLEKLFQHSHLKSIVQSETEDAPCVTLKWKDWD